MTVQGIARALGGAHRSGAWWRCRCPVHGSRSTTLAVHHGERGLILKCFAGCHPRDVLAELRRLGLIGDAAHDSNRRLFAAPTRRDERDGVVHRIAMARRIWDAARDAPGTPVARYLAGRGIAIPPPPVLRYAPRCPHPSGAYLPAMVARIDNVDGEPLIGIHRTFLRPDGSGKADVEPQKAMLGRAAGGAVRLAPAAETLLIAEGIETALALLQSTAMSVWAALSAVGIERLALPGVVQVVIVCADNDVSGAGQRAAVAAAERFLREGRRAKIAMPPEPGTDFADVLAGHGYARIGEVRHDAA